MNDARWIFSATHFRRFLYGSAGALSFIYALAVLLYVQSIPDIGLKSIFGTTIRARPSFAEFNPNVGQPGVGDEVVQVGDMEIATWSDLLNAPFELQKKLRLEPSRAWSREASLHGEPVQLVEVKLRNAKGEYSYWCPLTTLPVEFLVPSVLWFFLKLALFVIGAIVFWKRPSDQAAAQFFLLCVVTLTAYMGGYHWNHIATQPLLLLIFMTGAMLLPVVSLHFFLVFPRPKGFFQAHPWGTLSVLYVPTLLFLSLLITLYLRLRGLVHSDAPAAEVLAALGDLRSIIYINLGTAALWYLASVVSLIHGFLSCTDLTERNQVKWIMFGAVLALLPIGYSLYLTIWDPDAFGAGAATWPMFAASACLTGAFAIAITRYRLMELDKIISSGFGYFLTSFLAGLVYYGVVFLGTLIFNQVIASPRFSEALTVSTTALILMVVLDLARSRFKKILDRRFSRDKSQLDRTLQQLGQAVEQLVDPPALGQKLLHATTELLLARSGAVYLRQGDPPLYLLVSSLGPAPELLELSSGFPLVETLRRGGIVSLRQRLGGDFSPGQRQLQRLGGEIALPLMHESNLLGLLVLGPKNSPYGPEDVHLLTAFAQITVLALESAEGHRTIEELNRELQDKVDKISEQQRRILALQSQLRSQTSPALAEVGDAPHVRSDAGLSSPGGIVGSSSAIQQLLSMVKKVAGTDTVVLIRGESGTGKELLACALHETSPRADKPFVKVHCAALSSSILESELFGHVKGAFTSAHRDKVGRFELANGGTLFLDEIGDISLEVQTKLLRVLQEKTFERVGSSSPVPVDVRIITATHQNLEALIRQGKFREDLYYRLNVFPIEVPPLRNRLEDLPELAAYFMRQSALRCRKQLTQIDDDALVVLKGYAWPGNVRQLENVIERAVVIAEGTSLTLHDLPAELFQTPSLPVSVVPAAAHFTKAVRRALPRAERDKLEREHLVRILAANAGNKAEAARALGIARSTLVSRLKKLGLN